MNNKILYLECYSGISGDMTVSSLLDLGADKDVLLKGLKSLNLEGYRIEIGRRKKCGVDGCYFDVVLEDRNKHIHHHDHDHTIDDVDHSHKHHHHNGHSHEHRNLGDINKIIDTLESNERVKSLAKRMFSIVAEAESKAHGIAIEEVHFHEVGAIDSIIDIISTAICIDNLGISQVVVSQLYEGMGHVHCQHGTIPVPVPAVANIVSSYGINMKLTENEGEMITPTGAAIVAALKNREKLPDNYIIKAVGVGTGKKDFPKANILRAMIIEELDNRDKENKLWMLETNIDDCTGEALGYTLEKLISSGARDAYYSPIYMKKNRPAYLLSVICSIEDIENLESIIFTHTTTIGIRKYAIERTTLKREVVDVSTDYGSAKVKVTLNGKNKCFCPEYESIKEICDKTGLSFQAIYYHILRKAEETMKE